MAHSILVHYQEVALKGRNRPWFIDRLVRNLREITAGLGVQEVRPLMGRVEVRLAADAPIEAVQRQVARTFGVANFGLAERVTADVATISAATLRVLDGRPAKPFRVSVSRADKRFPLTSPDLEALVGRAVQDAYGWPVDLDRPETVARIEIVPGLAFVLVDKVPGPGGLPCGVSGRVACLLSGGIDSPVAAWRMMKRGCRAMFVHFHSHPLVSATSQDKAARLARMLTGWQLHARLVLVPFSHVQRQVVASAPAALRTVLYRRFMLRIAEELATRAGARGLVTGDVVGQVASQTLDNLAAVDAVARMPVFRPLIGMDKEEIMAEARRLGTYAISIEQEEDCCQVFTPAHPATHARAQDAEAAEAALPVGALVEEAVALARHESIDATVSREC